jgi:hypothetical protein
MQDQATSPIVIEDDASENNDDERPDAPPMYKIIWRIHLMKIVEMIPRIQLRMMGIIILLKIGY